MTWETGVEAALVAISQILTAGIAITALSLLLFAFTFNLRDEVSRTFVIILACVVVVFSAEALGSNAVVKEEAEFWLRLQWVGIIPLPAAYLHFSEALLSTTGQPSQGRRRWAVRLGYLISLLFMIALPSEYLVGQVIMDQPPAPHLQPTLLTDIFTASYLLLMALAWYTMFRAYNRTVTPTSRRRMSYLMAGALGPALGSFPFLLFGSSFAELHPRLFWMVAILANLVMGGMVVVMSYAAAFFGVAWPDRVVKARLFKWLMRGPVTASLALGAVTLVRRAGEAFGNPYTVLVPIVMVAVILISEYLITILAPLGQRALFYGNDRTELEALEALEDRLITRNDLRQFIEMVLAAVCDRLQAEGAALAALQKGEMELVAQAGKARLSTSQVRSLAAGITQENLHNEGDPWIVPVRGETDSENGELLGALFLSGVNPDDLEEDQLEALSRLVSRAALALRDRRTQEQVFQSLAVLTPQVTLIQEMRAAGSINPDSSYLNGDSSPSFGLTEPVKDALTHYWGGPRLTESPLLQLAVVQKLLPEHEGNAANALRAVLREAIERIRPEGERRYTAEWMLYNIVVMKFMEGKKVREIALKLAMSEADLYRKQRVAIDAVAKMVAEMDALARGASGVNDH